MLHEGVHAPIRLLTFMWHVGRPTAAIHLEFFGQTWLHPKTIKNIQKFWRPRGLLLPLNQLRARQWVCLFCLRQLQMLDSPATCPSPCHSQITNLRKAQVVLLHNFWERYLRGTEYISDIFCYIPLPFNFSVHWSQFKIEIGKKNKLLQLLIATINFDVIHLPLCQGVGILFKVILEASKALTSFPADISVGAKFQALLVNVLTLRRDQ